MTARKRCLPDTSGLIHLGTREIGGMRQPSPSSNQTEFQHSKREKDIKSHKKLFVIATFQEREKLLLRSVSGYYQSHSRSVLRNVGHHKTNSMVFIWHFLSGLFFCFIKKTKLGGQGGSSSWREKNRIKTYMKKHQRKEKQLPRQEASALTWTREPFMTTGKSLGNRGLACWVCGPWSLSSPVYVL